MLMALVARAGAGTAYVSDELVLGVYPEPNGQGQRLTTLHSGANLETLGVSGEYTQVRLSDGTNGWVKTSYLTNREPAIARLKQLQDELDRSRAATPALAEAAAAAAAAEAPVLRNAASSALAPALGPEGMSGTSGTSGTLTPRGTHGWRWALALLAALACGFGLGYATLARRVRHKFGGIKVY
jgi:uncharacterized protein YgiM (DUF1202 family)